MLYPLVHIYAQNYCVGTNNVLTNQYVGGCNNPEQVSWDCSNCEILNDETGTWTTSFDATPIIDPEGNFAGFIANGSNVDVRFLNSSEGTAYLYRFTDNDSFINIPPCGLRDRAYSLGPPSSPSFNFSGPASLMDCSKYNYQTFAGSPPPAWTIVDWTISNGLNERSSGSNWIKLSASNSAQAGTSETFQAHTVFNDPTNATCGTGASGIKTVNIVSPAPPNISGPSSVCSGSQVSYSASFNGANNPIINASYSWSYPSGWVVQSGSNSSSITFYIPSNVNVGGAVQVTASLPCGTFSNGKTVYPGGCFYRYSLYPNPTEGDTSADFEDEQLFDDKHKEKLKGLEFIIVDSKGKTKFKKQVKKKKNVLETLKLEKGIYYVDLTKEGKKVVETKRLVKQ